MTDEACEPAVLSTDNGDTPITPAEADFKITCTRCERDITECICAADWLGYRALWIAADRELQKLKKVDVDKLKADAQEFVDAALRDFEKQAKKIEILQDTLQKALSTIRRCIDGMAGTEELRDKHISFTAILESSKVE